MDKVPGMRKNDPDEIPVIPEDASSDDPHVIANSISDEMFEDAWNAEASSWAALGINPGMNIQIDQFMFKCKVELLIQLVIESDYITEDEFNDKLKRYMLGEMIRLRREHQSNIVRARLTDGIASADKAPKPGMFLPPGMKL